MNHGSLVFAPRWSLARGRHSCCIHPHRSANSGMDLTGLRVLVVEDERKVARALQEGLLREGCVVKLASSGEEGFFEAMSGEFDLILLDLNLPARDGLEVLQTLRKRRVSSPVLVLTARDSVEDRVLGLETGADDYLTKPFAFAELVARMKVLLRRGHDDVSDTLAVSDLELQSATRSVTRNGVPVHLTAKETDLLLYLMLHKDQIVTRAMIARDVWHDTQRATPLDNVIDVHIAHLRKKVDDGRPVKLLHTVRGIGFVLTQKKP